MKTILNIGTAVYFYFFIVFTKVLYESRHDVGVDGPMLFACDILLFIGLIIAAAAIKIIEQNEKAIKGKPVKGRPLLRRRRSK